MNEAGGAPGATWAAARTHTGVLQAARELAGQAAELRSVETLIDVGGGSGGFLIGLAETLPRLRGAVLDLPELEPVAEEYLRESGLGERVRFHPTDFRAAPLPPGADAYALLLPLQDRNPGAVASVLEQIADAAPVGGILILGDCLPQEECLPAPRGRFLDEEYRDRLSESGFTAEHAYTTSAGMRFLIARRLPFAIVEGGEQHEVNEAEFEEEEALAEAA